MEFRRVLIRSRGASRNAGANGLGGDIKGEASAEGRRRRTFAPKGIRARAHPLADARFPLRRRKTFLFAFFTPSVGQYPFSFPDRRSTWPTPSPKFPTPTTRSSRTSTPRRWRTTTPSKTGRQQGRERVSQYE